MVKQSGMFKVVQVFYTEYLFSLGNTLFCHLYTLCLDIDFIIFICSQAFDKSISLQIQVRSLFLTTRDNQWCSGFIDEDGVNFIDERIVQTSQYPVFYTGDHIVTQVVKTKFRVCCICNITCIGSTLLWFGKLTKVETNCQSKELMNLSHPLCVTGRKIFVNRNDMNTFATQCIEINRHNRCQGLTFTCLHFRNVTTAHDGSTHQLYFIWEFTDNSAACFTGSRKRFRKNIIFRSTIRKLFTKTRCLSLELLIRHVLVFFFHLQNRLDFLSNLIQFSCIFIKKIFKQICHGNLTIPLSDKLFYYICLHPNCLF